MYIKRALIALAGILLFSFGAWAQSGPSPAYRGDRSDSQSRDYNRRDHRDKHHRDKHRRDKHRRHEHNRYHNDYGRRR